MEKFGKGGLCKLSQIPGAIIYHLWKNLEELEKFGSSGDGRIWKYRPSQYLEELPTVMLRTSRTTCENSHKELENFVLHRLYIFGILYIEIRKGIKTMNLKLTLEKTIETLEALVFEAQYNGLSEMQMEYTKRIIKLSEELKIEIKNN